METPPPPGRFPQPATVPDGGHPAGGSLEPESFVIFLEAILFLGSETSTTGCYDRFGLHVL